MVTDTDFLQMYTTKPHTQGSPHQPFLLDAPFLLKHKNADSVISQLGNPAVIVRNSGDLQIYSLHSRAPTLMDSPNTLLYGWLDSPESMLRSMGHPSLEKGIISPCILYIGESSENQGKWSLSISPDYDFRDIQRWMFNDGIISELGARSLNYLQDLGVHNDFSVHVSPDFATLGGSPISQKFYSRN